MGKEEENTVADLEQSIFGHGDIAIEGTKTPDEIKIAEEAKIAEEKVEPSTKTTIVTDEQLAINQNIAVLDSKIEALKAETVDVTSFYESINEHLSEDEQALEFSDKPAYQKLVSDKAREYETKNSKADEIQTLEEEKKNGLLVYDRQTAIVEVTALYPDYNHEKMMTYFQKDLSETEQDKIVKSSTNYSDVYKKTYEQYKQINPTLIKQTPAPNIPDVNKVRKQTPSSTDVTNGMKTDDELLQAAIGF